MLPESTASLGDSNTVKMLAIVEQWNMVSGCHTGIADKYLLLMLFKLGMDAVVALLCCRKQFPSFISLCSLSIVLADLLMVFFIAHAWFLGPRMYPVSLCFLLAHASATYGALPLPIMGLGLLDYGLEDAYLCNLSACCKFLKNAVLTLLVWILAIIYSFGSVKPDLLEMDFENGMKALVCEVEESRLINYLILGVFAAVIFALLPFWSMIPQWMKEAEMLSEAREERHNQSSDLLFTLTYGTETKSGEENDRQDTIKLCPPLWASLTLGFGVFWMPYLSVSVACLIFGFAVPSYITVNLLWLECTNSLLMGVVFWVRSKTQGPYSKLPENVCLWHVYWHLSKGTHHQQHPMAVFNPSKEKRNTLLYV